MYELEMIDLVSNVARKVAKRFGPVAADAGLSMSEGLALWKISRKSDCKATNLAEQLGLPPSTVTGILDRLEAGGWLIRQADPGDRRATSIVPTKKLSEFIKGSKRSVSKILERSFRDLPPDFVGHLCADLRLVLETFDKDDETGK